MNRRVLLVIPAIIAICILIFVLLQSSPRPAINGSPNKPTALSQFRSDGVTAISEGGTTTEDTVLFGATLSDPDGDDARLEIELHRAGEPFTGEPTPGVSSDFVASGTRVTVGVHGLVESGYNWKCRARDSRGATSDWVEFGDNSGVDFEVSNGHAYLVVRGTDNSTYYCSGSMDSWDNWTALPGATGDSPAAAILGSNLHIVVNGVDGSIYYGWVNLTYNVWSGWSLLSGATQSSPTLASNGTALCLLVHGVEDAIYYCFYQNDSWEPWLTVPMGATCDSPAAAMLGNDLHIVVRGFSSTDTYVNDTLYHNTIGPGGETGWEQVDGLTSSRPVLAADASTGKIYLVVTGSDSRTYWRIYNASADTWSDWSVIEGLAKAGCGATVVGDKLYIAVLGMDDRLYYGHVYLPTGVFDGWKTVEGLTPSAPTLAG